MKSSIFVFTLWVFCLLPGLAPAGDEAAPALDGLRFRQATAAELEKIKLTTGGALVVESVPAALSGEVKAGDIFAFADLAALLKPAALESVVKAAAGKPVEVLFYRDGQPDTVKLTITPAMLMPARPGSTRPAGPVKIAGAGEAGKFIDTEWTTRPRGNLGSRIEAGQLKLIARDKLSGATAIRIEPIHGDFELRIQYVIDARDGQLLQDGFGIRFESAEGWKGVRIASFDRRGYLRNGFPPSDKSVATSGDEEDNRLSADARGPSGQLRVQRTGDKWSFSYRNAAGSEEEWIDLGHFTAKLSPEIRLWIASFKTGRGNLDVTIDRFELKSPSTDSRG